MIKFAILQKTKLKKENSFNLLQNNLSLFKKKKIILEIHNNLQKIKKLCWKI